MMKTLLAVGVAAATIQIQAISYNAGIDGTTAPTGALFTPVGGSLSLKTHNGFTGLGISGGASGAEIDLSQKLSITFAGPQTLNDLTLAFLYDGPEYNDGNELAAIKINGTQYVLTATGSSSSTWTGSGTVQNISLAKSTGGGVWKIINPIGNTPVTSIELYPLPYPTGKWAPNPSDFSLREFNTTAVPDGGATAVLLGFGTLALAALRRKE